MGIKTEEIEAFIETWPQGSEASLDLFVYFNRLLETFDNSELQFIARPGVTYSLRAAHKNPAARPLFTMIDVIDADPRWLSICFYSEMVTDPEERGDFVPGGLLGEDGICFDVETDDQKLLSYVTARINEAYRSVS